MKNQINIGVGTWQLGMRGWGKDYSSSDAKEALKFLINNGIKFIDTAEIYGNGESEKNVGEVLSNSKRDSLIIPHLEHLLLVFFGSSNITFEFDL